MLLFYRVAYEEEPATPTFGEMAAMPGAPETSSGVPAQIVGEWQIVAMERSKSAVDVRKIKSPKYVFRQDGTYDRQEDHGTYTYHPFARPDCLLKLYPKGALDGECLTLKCQWEAGAFRLILVGPVIREDEFESVTLKRVN
jgi:hypothetical protein